MALMMLSEAARATGGQLSGLDVPFESVTIDSRRLVPGALFVAIRGETFDGHDFLGQVAASGAAAAMVGGDAFAQGIPHPAIAAFFERYLKASSGVRPLSPPSPPNPPPPTLPLPRTP